MNISEQYAARSPFLLEMVERIAGDVPIESETIDQVPAVKSWIDAVAKNPKSNESLLLFVRLHPQPRLAIVAYLKRVRGTRAFAADVLSALAGAADLNQLLDDITMVLKAINFAHSKRDPGYAARFKSEITLQDDVAAALQKIATWRRVRAYQVRAVLETNPSKMHVVGRAFVRDVLRTAFPRLYERVGQSEVPVTMHESLGWHFQASGAERLTTDARFRAIVEAARKR